MLAENLHRIATERAGNIGDCFLHDAAVCAVLQQQPAGGQTETRDVIERRHRRVSGGGRGSQRTFDFHVFSFDESDTAWSVC